jgi:hypothetical protein
MRISGSLIQELLCQSDSQGSNKDEARLLSLNYTSTDRTHRDLSNELCFNTGTRVNAN